MQPNNLCIIMVNDMIISNIISYSRIDSKLHLKSINKYIYKSFIVNNDIYEYYKKEIIIMFRNIISNMKADDAPTGIIDVYRESVKNINSCLYPDFMLGDFLILNIKNVCNYFEHMLCNDICAEYMITKICKIIITTKIPSIFANYKKEIIKIMNHYCRKMTNKSDYKKYIICICSSYILDMVLSYIWILLVLLIAKDTPTYILIIPVFWVGMFFWHAVKIYVSYLWRKNKIPYYMKFSNVYVSTAEHIFAKIDIVTSLLHIIPIIVIEKLLNREKKYIDMIPEFAYYYYRSFDIHSVKKICAI